MARHLRSGLVLTSLLLLASAPALAQTTRKVKVGALPQWEGPYPIVVLPGERGFDDLQEALDHCALTPTRPSTVVLSPGTYRGNFTLPSVGTTFVVGRGGVAATVIEGAPGVSAPVLSFQPATGATETEVLLFDLQVIGAEHRTIEYVGFAASASLFLHHTFVESQGAFPAVYVQGWGYDDENELRLEVDDCWIESKEDGIEGVVQASHFEIHVEDSSINADVEGIDMRAQAASTDTSMHLFGGRVEGQTAVSIEHVDDVVLEPGRLDAIGVVVALLNVDQARIARANLRSQTADVVEATSSTLRLEHLELETNDAASYGLRLVSGSNAWLAYCGFFTPSITNAFFVEPGSTLARIYAHWQYSPLP